MAYRVDFADCLIPYSRHIQIYLEAYTYVQQYSIYIAFPFLCHQLMLRLLIDLSSLQLSRLEDNRARFQVMYLADFSIHVSLDTPSMNAQKSKAANSETLMHIINDIS